MSWYRKLPTPRTKADRLRHAGRADRANALRARKPVKIRPPKHVFFKTFSRIIFIRGIGVKVCTRNGIAKYFDVEHTTVLRWEDRGVLPEPFYHIDSSKGRVPVYLATQVSILRTVLSDLVSAGYVTIPWFKLPDHIAMLHEGYAVAADRAYRKFEKEPEIEKADAFGVVFYN